MWWLIWRWLPQWTGEQQQQQQRQPKQHSQHTLSLSGPRQLETVRVEMQPSVFLLSSAACAMNNPFLSSVYSLDFSLTLSVCWFWFQFFSSLTLFFFSFFFLFTTKPDLPVSCKPLLSTEQVLSICLPWLFLQGSGREVVVTLSLSLSLLRWWASGVVVANSWAGEGRNFCQMGFRDGFPLPAPSLQSFWR